MKILTTVIFSFLIACIISSCGDDADNFLADAAQARQEKQDTTKEDTTKKDTDTIVKPIQPVYPTFNRPRWEESLVSHYANTMTAFAVLPDSLAGNVTNMDEMAVLKGDEVRGVLKYTQLSATEYVWMGIIYGSDENEAMAVKYYSYSNSHMYYTDVFQFQPDGRYGTLDNPVKLNLHIVTK